MHPDLISIDKVSQIRSKTHKNIVPKIPTTYLCVTTKIYSVSYGVWLIFFYDNSGNFFFSSFGLCHSKAYCKEVCG